MKKYKVIKNAVLNEEKYLIINSNNELYKIYDKPAEFDDKNLAELICYELNIGYEGNGIKNTHEAYFKYYEIIEKFLRVYYGLLGKFDGDESKKIPREEIIESHQKYLDITNEEFYGQGDILEGINPNSFIGYRNSLEILEEATFPEDLKELGSELGDLDDEDIRKIFLGDCDLYWDSIPILRILSKDYIYNLDVNLIQNIRQGNFLRNKMFFSIFLSHDPLFYGDLIHNSSKEEYNSMINKLLDVFNKNSIQTIPNVYHQPIRYLAGREKQKYDLFKSHPINKKYEYTNEEIKGDYSIDDELFYEHPHETYEKSDFHEAFKTNDKKMLIYEFVRMIIMPLRRIFHEKGVYGDNAHLIFRSFFYFDKKDKNSEKLIDFLYDKYANFSGIEKFYCNFLSSFSKGIILPILFISKEINHFEFSYLSSLIFPIEVVGNEYSDSGENSLRDSSYLPKDRPSLWDDWTQYEILDNMLIVSSNIEKIIFSNLKANGEKIESEDEFNEWKSSYLYNLETNKQKDNNLKKEILTVASSFFNSKGGNIYLGINDNGDYLGVNIKKEGFRNFDELERSIHSTIYDAFKHNKDYEHSLLKLEKLDLDNKVIIKMIFKKSTTGLLSPKFNNQELNFYQRIGSSSNPLSPTESIKLNEKFKK